MIRRQYRVTPVCLPLGRTRGRRWPGYCNNLLRATSPAAFGVLFPYIPPKLKLHRAKAWTCDGNRSFDRVALVVVVVDVDGVRFHAEWFSGFLPEMLRETLCI